MHLFLHGRQTGAILFGTLALAGCSTPRGTDQHNHIGLHGYTGLHDYTGLDTSAGFRPHLSSAAILCAQRSGQMNPTSDLLTIFRVDDRTQEIYDNPPPADPDDVQTAIAYEAAAAPPHTGTFPARFWAEVTKRAETDTTAVLVDFYTDGDNDDMTPAARAQIAAAAHRLAANPHVMMVCIYGVTRENRNTLRTLFAPLGEHRLHLFGPTEMTPDTISHTFDVLQR